jgi:hypothetical protein
MKMVNDVISTTTVLDYRPRPTLASRRQDYIMSKFLWCFVALPALAACAVGGSSGGGLVLPSPSGDTAVNKACHAALPDILPATPITTNTLWSSEGIGSSADSLEILRMGFARVSFDVSALALADANGLNIGDTMRWSKAPLTTQAGTVTLEVAPRGDARCTAFEREVEGQRTSSDPKANTDDPMKYWTDTRFPPAPPEGRNWCIATLDSPDQNALRFSRTVTSSQEGQSNVSVILELVTDNTGAIRARRTQVRMYRPSFPIGISSVGTGCDGNAIGLIPEFWGPTGIALRPSAAPTLINK